MISCENDVWWMLHQDNSELFAVMEKMKLQIFHGTEPEVSSMLFVSYIVFVIIFLQAHQFHTKQVFELID